MLYDLNCKEQNGVRKITIASYAFLFTHFLANFVEKFKSQLSRDIEIELIEKRTEEAASRNTERQFTILPLQLIRGALKAVLVYLY